MEDTVNPEQGNESPENPNVEAAFEDYLKRQAQGQDEPAGEVQPEGAKQEAGEGDPEPEQRYKVKVNGEEREVPLSELVKGYQLESDYRVKTSQAAEQARAAQAQMQQAQQLQAHYAQQLQAYGQQLQTLRPQPPDPALIDSDPVGYLRQKQAFDGWVGQMQRVQGEQQQLQAHQAAQAEHWREAHLAQQRELLVKALPEFGDEKAAPKVKEELLSYLRQTGFTDDEIGNATDHRAMVLARKAQLYDQLIAKQGEAQKKVQNLPPRAPQKPGTGNVSALDGRTRTMQALKKSGSVEDAAQAFAAMLGGR